MKLSQYFFPTQKEVSSEFKLASHKYSIRAGLIKQCGSGIYTWLPMGLKIMEKIIEIINNEMFLIGANKILMPCIQQASLWKTSERYDSYGKEMLKIKDRHSQEMLFGPTNEELVTDLMKNLIHSYKNLPLSLYHIQWKFRDEIRPRFGILRAREFLMKDGYSFDSSKETALESYYLMFAAYLNIFNKIGINVIPTLAESGPIGGDMSHEFHLLNDTGSEESLIYDNAIFDHISLITNEEIDVDFYLSKKYKPAILKILNTYSKIASSSNNDIIKNNQYKKSKGIELGHVFYFGTKYSKLLNSSFKNKDGKFTNFHMGSYGIGISRLIAAIIENNHDDKGIIWPKCISPFDAIIVNLNKKNIDKVMQIYTKLNNKKIILDDSNDSPGVKLTRADLLGFPHKIIISDKNLSQDKVEIIERKSGKIQFCKISNLIKIYGV